MKRTASAAAAAPEPPLKRPSQRSAEEPSSASFASRVTRVLAVRAQNPGGKREALCGVPAGSRGDAADQREVYYWVDLATVCQTQAFIAFAAMQVQNAEVARIVEQQREKQKQRKESESAERKASSVVSKCRGCGRAFADAEVWRVREARAYKDSNAKAKVVHCCDGDDAVLFTMFDRETNERVEADYVGSEAEQPFAVGLTDFVVYDESYHALDFVDWQQSRAGQRRLLAGTAIPYSALSAYGDQDVQPLKQVFLRDVPLEVVSVSRGFDPEANLIMEFRTVSGVYVVDLASNACRPATVCSDLFVAAKQRIVLARALSKFCREYPEGDIAADSMPEQFRDLNGLSDFVAAYAADQLDGSDTAANVRVFLKEHAQFLKDHMSLEDLLLPPLSELWSTAGVHVQDNDSAMRAFELRKQQSASSMSVNKWEDQHVHTPIVSRVINEYMGLHFAAEPSAADAASVEIESATSAAKALVADFNVGRAPFEVLTRSPPDNGKELLFSAVSQSILKCLNERKIFPVVDRASGDYSVRQDDFVVYSARDVKTPKPEDLQIAQVMQVPGSKNVHIFPFMWARDTVLGDVADSRELCARTPYFKVARLYNDVDDTLIRDDRDAAWFRKRMLEVAKMYSAGALHPCQDISHDRIFGRVLVKAVKFDNFAEWQQHTARTHLRADEDGVLSQYALSTSERAAGWFILRKEYCSEFARFTDLPQEPGTGSDSCWRCGRFEYSGQFLRPVPTLPLPDVEVKNLKLSIGRKKLWGRVQVVLPTQRQWDRPTDLRIGDCVLLRHDVQALSLRIRSGDRQKIPRSKLENPDEATRRQDPAYAEIWRRRKTIDEIHRDLDSAIELSQPCPIGVVDGIVSDHDGSAVSLKFRLVYRPEDTHWGRMNDLVLACDRSYVLLSDERSDWVDLSAVVAKATLVYQPPSFIEEKTVMDAGNDIEVFGAMHSQALASMPPWTNPMVGRDGITLNDPAFYFSFGYDAGNRTLVSSIAEDREQFSFKKKSIAAPSSNNATLSRLRCLDTFAGCGGITEGLHQTGGFRTDFAIEFDAQAAEAFRMNFGRDGRRLPSVPLSTGGHVFDENDSEEPKGATCFHQDCNEVLSQIMSGSTKDVFNNPLPIPGSIDVLCGGPPCQGFSVMNRFSAREAGKNKNSLAFVYLSICDFLRPRYFVLENVRAFLQKYDGNMVRTALRTLLDMGYNVTFGKLNGAEFNTPQVRQRAFVVASAPGHLLPFLPRKQSAFAEGVEGKLDIDDDDEDDDEPASASSKSRRLVDTDRRYKLTRFHRAYDNLPRAVYRRCKVRDAIGDLPEVPAGVPRGLERRETDSIGIHVEAPNSEFQRLMRWSDLPGSHGFQERTRFHYANINLPDQVARMSLVPRVAGCDWRDIKNEAITCRGVEIKPLVYKYPLFEDLQLAEKKAKGGKVGMTNVPLRGVCICNSYSADEQKQHMKTCKKDGGCCTSEFSHTVLPWSLPHTARHNSNWAGLYGRNDWFGQFRTTITKPSPIAKQGQVVHPEQDRILTVRECARSQGFPDLFEFYQQGDDCDNMYKQIGNAVPPLLARALGFELLQSWQDHAERRHIATQSTASLPNQTQKATVSDAE